MCCSRASVAKCSSTVKVCFRENTASSSAPRSGLCKNLLWVQVWFEPNGSLLDGVLSSRSQSEKSVSILSVLNCKKACVIGFVGQCVSSRLSSIACILITPRRNSLTSSSVDDSVKPVASARTEFWSFSWRTCPSEAHWPLWR